MLSFWKLLKDKEGIQQRLEVIEIEKSIIL